MQIFKTHGYGFSRVTKAYYQSYRRGFPRLWVQIFEVTGASFRGLWNELLCYEAGFRESGEHTLKFEIGLSHDPAPLQFVY